MKYQTFPSVQLLWIFVAIGCWLADAQTCDQGNVQSNFGTQSTVPQRPCVPTLALDQSSVWLAWNKPDNYSAVVDFNIYSNGKKLGCASANAAKHSPAAAYIRNFYAKDVNHFHARMIFHAFLATGLQPNSSHTFTVRSVDARGHESADSVPVTVTTAPEYGNTINVTAFGAKCDNKTADTTVIQAAIDRCSNGSTSAFGCRVVVPAGRICVTGALSLRSNMTLEVAAGAMLRASTNVSDFAGSSASSPLPMLGATSGNYQNIRLLGPGTLDGNGWLLDSRVVDELNNSLPVYAKGNANTVSQLGLLAKAQVEAAGGAYSARSTLATFGKVTNLYIGSLRVVNPSKDTIKVQNSRNIVVANLRLHTYNVNNGDGVGFSSSQNALAFNNFFNTGDDCIATAAGQGLAGQQSRQPVQHLWVFNNYFREGHGAFVVGSQTAAWMQDILVEDNVLFRTDNGLRLKSTPATGGGARRIVFRDSAMLGVGVMQGTVSLGGRDFPINQTDLGGQYTQSPFIFTLAYTAGAAASSPANQSAQFRDIRVQRVSVDNGRPGQGGSFMAVDGYAGTDATLGYPESFHRNLTFLDVKFTNVAPANISRLANSTFTNVTISNWGNASSSPWAIRDSQNLTFTNVLCAEEECQF